MNPSEWLRSVTRHGGDDRDLACEAARALAAFAREPAGLVVACRRLLSHHPANGALWWLCSRVLVATDPAAAAREAADLLDRDRTAGRLSAALPVLDPDEWVGVVGSSRAVEQALAERVDLAAVDLTPGEATRPEAAGRCGLVLVVAGALDATRVLVPSGTSGLLDRLPPPRSRSVRRWLVGGVGTVLPAVMLSAVADAADGDVVALESFDRVAGHRGVQDPTEAAVRPDCPVAPELLRPLD